MPVFDTPDPVTVTVELPIGDLHVVASDRRDTTVEVHHCPEDRAEAERIRVDLAGDRLRITGPPLGLIAKLSSTTPGRSIEVEVAVPTGSALTVRSGYGVVRAEGSLGDCTVDAAYGDVRLESATSATVKTGHGQARVTGPVDGPADVVSDHGGVHLDHVEGTATLRSKHGPIRVREIVGTAELTGAYGDIDVDEVHGDARVRTAHGSIRLGRVARGEITLASVHGRMEIGIAGTTAAWLDLDTRGTVSNHLTPREDPAGFADTVSVQASSRSGAITVRRS